MRTHHYVMFYRNGESVTCIFMGKPDLEFDSTIGRTQVKNEQHVYHVAFDPVNVEREFIWSWFEGFTHGQAKNDQS